MRHLDTFSGIGGWALAARWMGWETQAFVEKDKFCQAVLRKNFGNTPIHDDIFTFSGKPFRGNIDILTGSTPCQPFSQAGKREGSNDERHLFPEFLRVVAEVRPRWIIIENVYGLLNIESGQVFEAYHTSLEGEGYTVQTICIPASALNAPHQRARVWIIAHANNIRRQRRKQGLPTTSGHGYDSPHLSTGLLRGSRFGNDIPPSRIFRSGDGFPNGVDRVRALGNAIVPQIAYELFRAIEQYESTEKS